MGGGIKNDVTEMIHLLTFQSINNVLYFFKLGGYRNTFIPPPLTPKQLFWGGGAGIKNDVTEMIHLLTFQSINNVLYFFKFYGGYRNIFYTPTPSPKKLFCWGGIKMM